MNQSSEPKNDAEFAAQAFSTLPEVSVSADLSRRIAQIPLEYEVQGKVWYWPFDRVWQPSLALAALALMGVFTGSVFDTADLTSSNVAQLLDTPQSETMPTNAENLDAQAAANGIAANDPINESGDAESEEELDNLWALALGDSWQDSVWDTLPESTTNSSKMNQEELHQ